MNLRLTSSVAFLVVLTACGPGPDQTDLSGDDAVIPLPLPAPLTPPFGGGLTEREPDLCGATGYTNLIGQPEAALATQTFTRRFRVVPEGGIVTQEYDGYRINFRLAGSGLIARVDCG